MSDQYNNELTFRLFKNDKGDNPKRPDYRGEAEIGGVHYWLSGWISEVKSGQRAGTKYIRGKVERKESAPPRPAQPQPSNIDTEDVPF